MGGREEEREFLFPLSRSQAAAGLTPHTERGACSIKSIKRKSDTGGGIFHFSLVDGKWSGVKSVGIPLPNSVMEPHQRPSPEAEGGGFGGGGGAYYG